MKAINLLMFFVVSIFLASCATSSYKVGRDFDSQSVAKIEKGKTTKDEIVKMFGEPFTKSVISANQEKWIYTYASGAAKAQSYVVVAKVETTGNQKTLDILLQDGVVINFSFVEGQNPYSAVVQ